MNYTIGGRASGLEREFAARVTDAFMHLIKSGASEARWESKDVTELWDYASENLSSDAQELEIDWDVLIQLASDILSEIGAHTDFGSQLEGYGEETEYTLIYDDAPANVVDRSIERLDQLLKPI